MYFSSEEDQKQAQNLFKQSKEKLINFTVKNQDNQVIGKIKEARLEKDDELSLIVSPMQDQESFREFILNSKNVQKVDFVNRSLFVKQTPESTQKSASGDSIFSENRIQESHLLVPDPEQFDSVKESDSYNNSELKERETIRLLEERLAINRSKQKVGEVVARKEVETRMVQVPVRREKLIVEQVSPTYQQLAEIDLGNGEVTGIESAEGASTDEQPTVRGEFLTPYAAIDILKAIARQERHGCAQVRVELVLEDSQFQQTYQKMFDRSTGKFPNIS